MATLCSVEHKIYFNFLTEPFSLVSQKKIVELVSRGSDINKPKHGQILWCLAFFDFFLLQNINTLPIKLLFENTIEIFFLNTIFIG